MRDRQSIAAAHRWRGSFRHPLGHTRIGPRDGVSLLSELVLGRTRLLPDLLVVEAFAGRAHARTRIPVQRYRQQTRLSLPIRGRWLVLAGHARHERHASLHISSQRFAYDLVAVEAGGATYKGDPRENASYFVYDRPVRAVADGVVSSVNDGVRTTGQSAGVRLGALCCDGRTIWLATSWCCAIAAANTARTSTCGPG